MLKHTQCTRIDPAISSSIMNKDNTNEVYERAYQKYPYYETLMPLKLIQIRREIIFCKRNKAFIDSSLQDYYTNQRNPSFHLHTFCIYHV